MINIGIYRPKITQFQAVQYFNYKFDRWEFRRWLTMKCIYSVNDEGLLFGLHLLTKDGVVRVEDTWWLVKGTDDDIIVCPDDIFRRSYDRVPLDPRNINEV